MSEAKEVIPEKGAQRFPGVLASELGIKEYVEFGCVEAGGMGILD